MEQSVTKTEHPYIVRVQGVCGGEPVIINTRTPVRSIVVYHLHLGDSVDEIIKQLPHLNYAQVYDALSYYFDHKQEIDELIRINNDEEYWKKYLSKIEEQVNADLY